MFIKIDKIYYFILHELKSVNTIFEEIFKRMNKNFISNKEKQNVLYQIKTQLKNENE
jgi:hypothetical protein